MNDQSFQKYRRTNIAEMRPYIEGEKLSDRVSISASDLEKGSPKTGDMIARNPKSHDDQWLVAAKYFSDNFELYDKEISTNTTSLLKECVQELSVKETPSKREMYGEWVEAVCAIGVDEVAYITMTKEAYEELKSKTWD